MRFLHIADLHFGKYLHGLSLTESGDQAFWVDRFLELAGRVKPDAVLIAGDVYDRSSPPAAATRLLSRLVSGLAERDIAVFLTAGNHDSPARLAFAAPLLEKQGVIISAPLQEERVLTHVTLRDAFGPVTVWLMPYIFPALIGEVLGGEMPATYDEAVRRLLAEQPVDFTARNVLVAHQNVTSGGKEVPHGGSESMVGGVGQVNGALFDGFDYVALGHIHAAYPVGRESMRYAGSPLCYHFDELKSPKKGPLLVELGEKGAPARVETISLEPLHPLREARGSFEVLQQQEALVRSRGEYLRVAVTDRKMTPEMAEYFRGLAESRDSVLMECISEYRPFREEADIFTPEGAGRQPLDALFAGFYMTRSGQALSAGDEALLHEAAQRSENRRQMAGGEKADALLEKEADALLNFLLEQEEA